MEKTFEETQRELRDAVKSAIKRINAQRTEILEAFIAKYGFDPDRMEQVEQRMEDGTTVYFIRKKQDANERT